MCLTQSKLQKTKMGTLEQVMDLKSKGSSDADIISSLREQGVSPKAIIDALSQAKIKGAISSGNGGNNEEGMERSVLRPETAEDLPTEGSISDEDLTPPSRGLPTFMQQQSYVPLHQEAGEEEYVPQPQEDQGGQYNTQSQGYQYQPQEYTQQEGQEVSEYQPGAMASSDTDTIIEISEQVFAERMKGAVKQLESLIEFKTLSETKIENISHRLARIEASIDKLQIAILEKVGSYGRGLDSMKKEVEMVQDSFSKIVNKVAEKSETRTREHTEHHNKPHHVQEQNHQAQPLHTVHRIEKKTTVVHKSQKSASGKKHSKK
jgi:predicted transcriptional regulator